jgi:tight adherence protein B
VLALSSILVFATTFLAAALAVLVGWFTLQRIGAEAAAEDVSERLGDGASPLLKDNSLSTISLWARLLGRFDFGDIMRRQLSQAALTWSVGRLTLFMLLTGSVALAILMRLDWLPGWGAVPLACGAALCPYLYVLRKRSRRFRKFEEAFPDALESLARALRAGHPFPAAMEIVASESEPPISAEFRRATAEGNLGASWDQALQNLSERVPLLEVNMFASAVLLQNRVGGKLNEVLAKLAENMRESTGLKGEVRALAAHGKLTGAVLTILPLVIAAVMAVVNPAYIASLVHYEYGKDMIAAAAVCLVLAHFVIRKIVDIRI